MYHQNGYRIRFLDTKTLAVPKGAAFVFSVFIAPVSVERRTAPASELVTLDEAKAHLRVTGDAEDDYITSLIPAAREACEDLTKRSLIRQGWTAWYGADDRPDFPLRLRLARPRFAGNLAVFFFDAAGTELPGASAVVLPDSAGGVATVSNIPGSAVVAGGRIRAEWESGPEAPGAWSKPAVLLMLANLFENRTPTAPQTMAEVPLTLRTLLERQTVLNV